MTKTRVEAGDRALETARKLCGGEEDRKIYVYGGLPEFAGHDYGWASAEQIAALIQSAMNASDAKWQLYEREYILPQFEWAKERGIDLQQLVKDNPGKNCSRLFYEAMNAQERELREALRELYEAASDERHQDQLSVALEKAERLI